MATKLKNIKYSIITKAIAFILAVACLTGITATLAYLDINTNVSFDSIFEDDYLKSIDLKYELSDISYKLERILKFYKSEEYIKSGGTIDQNSNNSFSYSHELRNLYSDFKRNSKEYSEGQISEKELLNEFETLYAKEIDAYKKIYINRTLSSFNKLLNEINDIDGLYYYMSSEEYKYTNSSNTSKEFFTSKPAYKLFDMDGYNYSSQYLANQYYSSTELGYYPQDILYIALDETFLNPKIEKWNEDCKILQSHLLTIALLMLGFIASIIYLLIYTGRKSNDDNVHLSLLDKLYIDINIFVTFSLIAICFGILSETFDYMKLASLIPCMAVSSALGINLLLSIIKHIKNKTIIKHNLSYKILVKIYSFIIRLFSSLPVALRMIPTPRKASDLKNIIKGVDQIKNGELDYVINTSDHGIYSDLAKDINGITSGLKAAVNNELKSERLKTELISNVSHDIRTPLTSIINYVDLLKREGFDSENAEKYLSILEQKSQRLKTLTDDLFEASKASSGDIPVNLTKVDISSLLIQCMGELDDKIAASNLDFQLDYPEEKAFVKADGRLLWRVLENLISNILKYSLQNTRVYINVIPSDNTTSIVLKNISSSKLNISADELTERFKRGDESRTSEGSGLGLSIAKSLVELQKGNFDINIDGDLFKVNIDMPTYKE
ncbi:sensor histidine kinase [Oceanirhabdus sp. W0125-5]|uniref:sensor histidine kinase n=1 Tax=Oceanirhabdus sp. W0125-5 TaxID=2999116 RepID=UPI0022F2CCEC|nr:HAMP domain-containing sensor histidine kinase [Oceanirhabdus sp. W0125-5]WBW97779.1 HAMP domain-containing sensor histidine kinase [Oceanirhabdus sp. W0125-5]